MKQNLNSDELFRVLEHPDDETLLYLSDHYMAADKDTMDRIFKKSQQKYKLQSEAKEDQQNGSIQAVTQTSQQHFTLSAPAGAETKFVQDVSVPPHEPDRRFLLKRLIPILTAAACVAVVSLELYFALHILTVAPPEQLTETNDVTDSSGETGETKETTQTTTQSVVTEQVPETSLARETGLVFGVDPVETTYTAASTTTAASGTTSTHSTAVTETTTAIVTGTVFTGTDTGRATQKIAVAAPANASPSEKVTRQETIITVSSETAAVSAPIETVTTAATLETDITTAVSETVTTAAEPETETPDEIIETELPQQTEPDGQEVTELPGFTVEILHPNAQPMRSIEAVIDPDAPQTIETPYELTDIPSGLPYEKEYTQYQTDENGTNAPVEYSKNYLRSSQERSGGLHLTQYLQADFSDFMGYLEGDDFPELFTVTVNDNPGCYYGMTYKRDGGSFTAYVLYWKQDGYIMMLHNDYALSLEQLLKAAESVAPQS